MPAGTLLTVPLVANGPVLVTVSTEALLSRSCADTVAMLLIVQASRPAQAPPHWTKDHSASGMADRTTFVSASNRAEQVALHSIPGGLDLTVPPPGGSTVIVISNVGASVISRETVAPGIKSVFSLPE